MELADWNGDDAWHGRAETVVIADGPRWRAHVPAQGWQVTIWVRTAPTSAADGYRG